MWPVVERYEDPPLPCVHTGSSMTYWSTWLPVHVPGKKIKGCKCAQRHKCVLGTYETRKQSSLLFTSVSAGRKLSVVYKVFMFQHRLSRAKSLVFRLIESPLIERVGESRWTVVLVLTLSYEDKGSEDDHHVGPSTGPLLSSVVREASRGPSCPYDSRLSFLER